MNQYVSLANQPPPYTQRATLQAIPSGGSAVYDSETGTAGSAVTSTLNAKNPLQTVYLLGFTVTSGPPTGGVPLTLLVTVSDGTWTLNFQFVETVSAGGWLQKELLVPIVATVSNGVISISVPANGSGGVVAIESHGYSL